MNNPNDVVIRLGADDSGLPPPIQRTNAAIASIGKTAEVSARQTAQAMRQLPAQFTDIATQLAGGQNIGLVLLQQGGQIKDSFGGAKNALAALAGAITPAGVAVAGFAGGVALLATAAFQGARESAQLRDTIALTGNAAGLTSSRLVLLAEQVAASSQQTIGGSKEILLALASSGQVSSQALGSAAVAVARLADVSGQDSKKIAADFATMSGGVAKWAAEHNKAWNFITLKQYQYIEQLEAQGKAEQAMVYVVERVAGHLKDQGKNLGWIEGLLAGGAKKWDEYWRAALSVGRDESIQEKMRAKYEDLAKLTQKGEPPPNSFQGQQAKNIRENILLLMEQSKQEVIAAQKSSEAAAKERKAIADERAAKDKAAPRESREKPYIPSEFQVLDARDGMVLAARREKEASESYSFFQAQLRAQEERDAKRAAQNDTYLQALLDANERAAAEQITDERARGEALIRLDREQALRRLKAQNLEGEDLSTATGAIDQQTLLRRKQLDTELAQSAGSQTYQNIYSAAAAALQETSGNPVTTFAQTLGRAVFQQITNNAAQALALAAVGKDPKGSVFGDLISMFLGIKFSGSSTDVSAPNYENQFDLMNAPAMATGTNYLPRNMLVMAHEGEAIVPKKYNPAAGGAAGGPSLVQNTTINVDSRSDRAQVAEDLNAVMRNNNVALLDELRSRGVLV